MVFENVTLFEVHLDDAQFGPRDGRSGDDSRSESVAVERSDAGEPEVGTDSGGEASADAEGSGRGRFAKLAVASVVVSVVATVVARRLAGRGDDSEFDERGGDEFESGQYGAETADETEPVAGPSGAGDD
ncbi:hypothetical protein [Halosimplex amylolyticum]|uniref:hypothetical protein n=1 Tax=Halosimplex amylolyticum TaxID=3396616 RepID=UPI003F54EBA2